MAALRETLLLPLDDLLAVTREFIHPEVQYRFAAIDRATRWVYVERLQDKSAASAGGFLTRLIDKAPFTIT